MSIDVLFCTESARNAGFAVTAEAGRHVESDFGVESFISGRISQPVAGWDGIVMPSGRTCAHYCTEVVSALDNAGVKWEVWA